MIGLGTLGLLGNPSPSQGVGLLQNTTPLAILGDSITEHNIVGFLTAGTEEASYSAREYLTWARALNVGGKHENWWDNTLADKYVSGHNFGHSGDKLVQVYARTAGPFRVAAGGILVIEIGTNNVDSASSSDNTTGYITTGAGAADGTLGIQGLVEQALAAGVKYVVLSTITPRPLSGVSSWAHGSAARNTFQAVNAWIRAYCAAHSGQVKLFDYCAALSQGDADDTPLAGVLNADNVHPIPAGGYLGGLALKAVVDKLIVPLGAPVIGTNYFPNPTFTGSGGTGITNFSGTVPNSLRILRPSGTVSLAVGSVGTLSSARPEAPNGQPSYTITWTPSGSAAEEFDIETLAGQIAAASLPAVGTWMEVGAYLKCSAGPGVMGAFVRSQQKPSPASNMSNFAHRYSGSAMPAAAWEGWVRSPKFQLRSGIASLNYYMGYMFDSTSAIAGGVGSISIEVCSPYLIQVPDPTFVTT